MLAAGDVIYDTFDPVSLTDPLGKFAQNGEDETRQYPVFTVACLSCHAGIAQQTDWIDGSQPVLQTLDKVTARIQTVDAVISSLPFGTLEITRTLVVCRNYRLTIQPSLGYCAECWQVRITVRTTQNSIKDIAYSLNLPR